MLKASIFLLGLALVQAAVISPALKQTALTKDTIDIIVILREKTSTVLNQLKLQTFVTRTARLDAVAGSLKSLAAKSQKPILAFLNTKENIKVTSLWINNKISVNGANLELINSLAAMPEVESIIEDGFISLNAPAALTRVPAPSALQWGINTTDAPAAWNLGYTGAGVVVATIDSGVRLTHKSLYRNYRWTFGWFDPILGSVKPEDLDSHGTHTMGTLAGSGGVGMAPDAQWIACRGCGVGACSSSALEHCGQFMLCPTYVNGTEAPDCSNAPHLVSNSWGGGEPGFFQDTINAWEAAGIIPIFAIGNYGPECSSLGGPGDLPNVIGVGATDVNDTLVEWSSVGPTTDGRIKPEVVAPGADIISASNEGDDAYRVGSGTSFSAPHVAGAAALLLSNGAELTFSQVSELLYAGAQTTIPETGRNCGDIPESKYPNNHVGHGRISILASIGKLRKMLQNN